VGQRVDRLFRRRGWTKSTIAQEQSTKTSVGGHIVVVGYGPAGREVVEAAREIGLSLIVFDLNSQSVIEARKLGLEAYVGDATQPDILRMARLSQAIALVVTLPDHRITTAIIVEAKDQCPDLKIVARARHHRYFGLLEGAGATIVVDEEAQVGRRMSSYITSTAIARETPKRDDVPKDLHTD